ncbi:8-oxoguanine DNA glycosylase [Blumeria hordei DH14]|uniref:DNA-(apurinic or apyrimidinic site) lyase n=1 Tax=Blumeria graminis f. sp. hordei (strain DH14) TaxID=546991 RepID=N1J7F6_BLUG1|nr:8-oxoguanine DNA glycosylase [Blumeria hordei DH14]
MASLSKWRKIPITPAEICIDTILRCGQSFRWVKTENNEWNCVLSGRIVSLKQDETHLHYRATWPRSSSIDCVPSANTLTNEESSIEEDDTRALLENYLNLKPKLTSLYEKWSLADSNFKEKAPRASGIRLLKQDAWEALVGFICSSNNNIIRISKMIRSLCSHYGPFIGQIGDREFHDFPTPETLAKTDVESKLKALGFGYRAKYIVKTAIVVSKEMPPGWLESLGNQDPFFEGDNDKPFPPTGREKYRYAHDQLLQLVGVGPKVADCVCLMGLGWDEAIPVDTHVWQIAQRDYKFGKGKHKTLSKSTYDAIGNHFRQLWGGQAGWAHSVLFTADLRVFSGKPLQELNFHIITKRPTEEEAGQLKKVPKMLLKREDSEDNDMDRNIKNDENSSKVILITQLAATKSNIPK